MEKMRRTFYWTILASELGHIFCCVLPVILSLISIFSLYGAINAVPGFIWATHDFMHHWEPVILTISALLLFSGWALWSYQKKLIVAEHVCHDDHCTAQNSQNKMRLMLFITTGLFVINFSVYALIHSDDAPFAPDATSRLVATHDHHHGHIH